MDGNAIIYCEGAFNTPNGKTAHGLVRFTERYKILSVIDSNYAGQDSGCVLDNKANGIPIVNSLETALNQSLSKNIYPRFLVIGLAPDGGKLPLEARKDILTALNSGLNIDSGLHDFLSEDLEIGPVALKNKLQIRDVRKPPSLNKLHFFNGIIEQVNCLVLAVLGTDSALGKRTTAWILVNGLKEEGINAVMIGTGQTAWMQGAKYSLVLDSLVNDFVSGEIEHAVYSAWKQEQPDVIVLEGQGSLMNPAYPGGFEILAAGRPDYVILQHAPARKEYDGFPGYPIQPIEQQIHAIEIISGRKVLAITINHENLIETEIPEVCRLLKKRTGLPVFDVLMEGPKNLNQLIKDLIQIHKR